MRTAILGGTFDPVHLGHLHLVHCLAVDTDYERVIVIPVANPPHKEYEASVSDSDRIAMLRLALAGYTRYYPHDRKIDPVVDDCEIKRGGVSYMYDTVVDVLQRYAVTETLGMVVGDDLLEGLSGWHRFPQLSAMVEFIVCRRMEERPPHTFPPGSRGRFIDNPVIPYSSSGIRNLIASGASAEDLASLIPDSVIHYIDEHGLYRD